MTPEQIAADVVNRFPWHSNVVEGGCLVGQQHAVARAIAEAIKQERERCAMIPEQAARALITGRRRTNQVDRHTAEVLMRMGEKIRTAL